MQMSLYEECFIKEKSFDLRNAWDQVHKFNAIANPDGIKQENQHPLIVEEFKELDTAPNKLEVLDALCDTLVTTLPMVLRENCIFPHEGEAPVDFITASQRLSEKSYDSFLFHVQGMCQRFTGDVLGAFNEVMRSNMTKFLELDKTDPETEYYLKEICEDIVESYKDKGKAVKGVFCREVEFEGSAYAVFINSETGKVLKPPFFEEPELDKFI